MSIDTDEVISERGKHYGKPDDFFEQLRQVWGGLLMRKLRPHEALTREECVAMFLCMKGLRAFNNPNHLDSWIDAAGYADIGHALSNEKLKLKQIRTDQILKDAEEREEGNSLYID